MNCASLPQQSDPDLQQSLIALCCLNAGAIDDASALVSFARQVQVDKPALAFQREYILGTALLRDGEYKEAIAELRKVASNPLLSASYPLALAYQAMGNVEAAREQLAAGDAWFEQLVVTGNPIDWRWSVIAQIWRKEAHQQVQEAP